MSRLGLMFIATSLVGLAPVGASVAADRCLSPAQMRETVAARKLAEPVAVLRRAAGQTKAEPVSARLCRHGESYVYDITLLRADGKVLKLAIDAASGKALDSRR